MYRIQENAIASTYIKVNGVQCIIFEERFYLGCKLDPTSSLEIKDHEKGTGKGSLEMMRVRIPIVTAHLEVGKY